MRKPLIRMFAAVALMSACTAGVGPIGVGPIGGREDPGNGLESLGGGQGSQGSGTPSTSGGGSGTSGSGGGTSSLDCSGDRTCTSASGASFTTTLKQKSQGCEAEILGDTYTLTSGGTVEDSDGTNYGTWSASGSSVVVCDTKSACVTCVPTGSTGVSDSGTSAPSDGSTNTSPTLEAGYRP